jgi:hypothetical protein
MQIVCYFVLVLANFEIYPQGWVKIFIVKFYENRSDGVAQLHADSGADKRDDASGCLSQVLSTFPKTSSN